MPRVNIPNLGTVNFPDSMSSADIEHEAGKLYLSYAGNLPGVERPENPITREIERRQTAGLAGVPGGAPQVAPATPAYQAAVGVPVAGAAAVMGGATVLPAVIAGARNPAVQWLAKRALATAAISQARKLPYVGPLVPPAAEMLPWLYSGGGVRAVAQGAGAVAAGEVAPYVESQIARQAEALGERVNLRSAPTPSPTTPPPQAAMPEPSFPPPQGRTAFQQPSRYQALQDEAGLQQQMREDLEAHGRNAALEEGRIRRAASTVDVPKSTLIERARAGTVTYTNAPPPATKSAAVVPKTRAETMRLMKESIQLASRRKGRIQ